MGRGEWEPSRFPDMVRWCGVLRSAVKCWSSDSRASVLGVRGQEKSLSIVGCCCSRLMVLLMAVVAGIVVLVDGCWFVLLMEKKNRVEGRRGEGIYRFSEGTIVALGKGESGLWELSIRREGAPSRSSWAPLGPNHYCLPQSFHAHQGQMGAHQKPSRLQTAIIGRLIHKDCRACWSCEGQGTLIRSPLVQCFLSKRN